MPTTENVEPGTEREQTDESLRLERAKADDALTDILTAIDETADQVISRARERADNVVAKARHETDRKSGTPAPDTSLARERSLEDKAVHLERERADESIRQERAAQTAVLAIEREETDKDLSSERALSDRALATRDEFLGIVSHDLRNLLGGVVGCATLIEQGIKQGMDQATVLVYSQRIRRSSARMDRLIGDLVDVASIEAGVLAVTRAIGDPAAVVIEAVETFQAQASSSSVSVLSEIMPTPKLSSFDPARILQVLTNLLSNAIKFTPPAGTVVVSVDTLGAEIRFGVRDTGIGIAPEQLSAVFERYRQVASNDRRGVGLGLYISKCIVQGHGGRIWAESNEDQGSTFYFTLPMHVAV